MRSIYHPPQVAIIPKVYHPFRRNGYHWKKSCSFEQDFFLELVAGLEPATCSLRVSCSTNWATQAHPLRTGVIISAFPSAVNSHFSRCRRRRIQFVFFLHNFLTFLLSLHFSSRRFDRFRQNHKREIPPIPPFSRRKQAFLLIQQINIISFLFWFYNLLSTLSTEFSTWENNLFSIYFQQLFLLPSPDFSL